MNNLSRDQHLLLNESLFLISNQEKVNVFLDSLNESQYDYFVEKMSTYLMEKYDESDLENLTEEQILNELFSLLGSRLKKDKALQDQLGKIAAGRSVASYYDKTGNPEEGKSIRQGKDFGSDVLASLKSEKGIKGFLTRHSDTVAKWRMGRRKKAVDQLQAEKEGIKSGKAPSDDYNIVKKSSAKAIINKYGSLKPPTITKQPESKPEEKAPEKPDLKAEIEAKASAPVAPKSDTVLPKSEKPLKDRVRELYNTTGNMNLSDRHMDEIVKNFGENDEHHSRYFELRKSGKTHGVSMAIMKRDIQGEEKKNKRKAKRRSKRIRKRARGR